MTIEKSKVVTPNQGRAGTRTYLISGHDDVPNMYQPTITMRVAPNKSGTNNAVHVNGRMPIVSKTADGVWKQTSLIKVDFQATALQNVNVETETAELLDAVIEIITAQKAEIVEGFYEV